MTSDFQNEIFKTLKSFETAPDVITGVCSATPFYYLAQKLAESPAPFVGYPVKRRIDPRLTLPNCKSIIILGLSYNKKTPPREAGRGAFSLMCAGEDYHRRVEKKLREVTSALREIVKFDYMPFTDTGPLVERELLYRASLAFEGKNFCAINEKLGSMFNIGYCLTDLDLSLAPGGQKIKTSCGGACARCVEACPGGAIGGKTFLYKNCVSYITQKRGRLSPREESLLNGQLYGCDICQTVCPHNTGKEVGEISDINEIYPKLDDILRLNAAQYGIKYRNRAFFWVGLKTLKRNAKAAKKNAKEPAL